MENFVKQYFSQVSDALRLGNTETAYNVPIIQFLKNFDCIPVDLSGERLGETGENIDIKLWHVNQEPSEIDAFAGVEVKKIGGIDNRANRNIKIETEKFGNVILTDNGRWEFWHLNDNKEPERVAGVKIMDYQDGKLSLLTNQIPLFISLIQNFIIKSPNKIRTSSQLATYMAIHARTIRDVIKGILKEDENGEPRVNDRQEKLPMFPDLYGLFLKIKEELSPKLNTAEFADMYAQTIVYGLFIARYNDLTPDDFSRDEALGLLQKESVLLKQFFIHITTAQVLHPTLIDVIDKLCYLYRISDVSELLDRQEKSDTIVHFYEDFLKAYDPKLRKEMGVFYTPQPIVQYLVKMVDRALVDNFGIEGGLSNNDTIPKEVPSEEYKTSWRKNAGVRNTKSVQVPRVAILDPATGTGTFHAEIIKYVKEKYFSGSRSVFYENYIENPDSLMSRLIGFEIMMTSYVVAHLKIRRTIDETLGHSSTVQLPSNIYLTNTLAPVQSDKERVNEMNLFLDFSGAISDEAYHADTWKKRRPVKVIIGNPPYLATSSNPFNISEYKKEADGITPLNEKNSKWLNDDYVKFFKFSENILKYSKDGILAFVSNNGYLDNPTFRGMRAHLLRTFDTIYIINLHGNSNKKEKSPDGSKDENVFDIKVGIALFIGIKNSNNKKWASVYYTDVYGTRKHKFNCLNEEQLNYEPIIPDKKMALFVPYDLNKASAYEKGVSLKELFSKVSAGIVTGRDGICIRPNKQDVDEVIRNFSAMQTEELRKQYKLGKDSQEWTIDNAREDILNKEGEVAQVAYRVFDDRWTYFSGKSKGFICRPRTEVMSQLNDITFDNLALTFTRSDKSPNKWSMIFASNKITESCYLTTSSAGIATVAPLFIYNAQAHSWQSNINSKVSLELTKNLSYVPEPREILNYCYGILFDPDYREEYNDFLKRDYPRICIPENDDIFKVYARGGAKLINLHLKRDITMAKLQLVRNDVNNLIINSPKYVDGRLKINSDTSIEGINVEIWKYRIGGYQVLDKWFKSHKNEVFDVEKFNHICSVVAILGETIKIQEKFSQSKLL